jgi:GNAT superfamily N-acetyltransferase
MARGKPAWRELEFHPVTADRWRDLVTLFEGHGNPGYCWCTLWRLPSQRYTQLKSAGRKRAMHARVKAGVPVGVLAYRDGEPAGWCSIAPRETYERLERSKTLKRIDDEQVWSVVCFFVKRSERGQGLPVRLLRAAVEYAISQGARVVEGYPVEPGRSYRFMGSPAVFEQSGFRVAARAENGRAIVRYVIGE